MTAYTLEARTTMQAVAYDIEGGLAPHGQLDSQEVAFPLKATDFKDVQAVAFAENSRAELRLCGGDGSVAAQLTTGGGKPGQGQPVVAFDCKGTEVQFDATGSAPPLRSMGHDQSHANAAGHAAVASRWAVRRLTPMECERLQGFPDGYTDVPYGRRNSTPDGPRYKALGNSMAVNAMEWIGERIAYVEGIAGGG